MKLFHLTLAAVIAAGSAVVAQEREGEAYCQHLLDEIAIKQQSVNGLTNLVNGNAYTLLTCDVDWNNDFYVERNECLNSPGVQGFWEDQETRTFYVVYTKQFVSDYAQNIGASSADLQRSFAIGDDVANKIRYGGVVESLEVEITSWRAEYDRACASFRQDQQNTWDPSHGLLNVLPDN